MDDATLLTEIRDILRDRLFPTGAVVELDNNASAGKFKVRVRAPGETPQAAGDAALAEFTRQMAALEEGTANGWRETLALAEAIKAAAHA